MKTIRKVIERHTEPGTDIHDLSEEVASIVADSGVRQGMVLIYTPGSTAGITTLEYESGAVADLARVIERIAPEDDHYEHDARWGDGNGYSHARAALLGPSLSLAVVEGRPQTGTWQQIVLCDFDNRPRQRHVIVQVMGG